MITGPKLAVPGDNTPITENKPGLTDLARVQSTLATELLYYTRYRNYLFAVMNGDAPLPELSIYPATSYNDVPDEIKINLEKLSKEAVNEILSILLENQTRLAMDTWDSIRCNATDACVLINEMKKASAPEPTKMSPEYDPREYE